MTIDFSKYTPIGKQTGLTIDNTVGGIGLTVPSGAKPRAALVQVFTAAIRFWVDGTAPTASTGHRAAVNDQIELASYAEIASFKAIREGATSADLEVTYFG